MFKMPRIHSLTYLSSRAGSAHATGGSMVVMFCNIVVIESLTFRRISSFFSFLSSSLNGVSSWRIRICFTRVDFPDSPAPRRSRRWVALYTCLSFWICLSISLFCFRCRFSSSTSSLEAPLMPQHPIPPASWRGNKGITDGQLIASAQQLGTKALSPPCVETNTFLKFYFCTYWTIFHLGFHNNIVEQLVELPNHSGFTEYT